MDFLSSLQRKHARLIGVLAVIGCITIICGVFSLLSLTLSGQSSLISRLGSAAVYLGVSSPSETASPLVEESVFPTETESLDTTSESSSPSTAAPITPGKETSSSFALGGDVGALSGLADLSVTISGTGYLTSTSTSSFVATSTVPFSMRPAVRFVIENKGTNVTGVWRFSVKLPTDTSYTFESPDQTALYPGESVEYTLGFDETSSGENKEISITANSTDAFTESDTENNTDSAVFSIASS